MSLTTEQRTDSLSLTRTGSTLRITTSPNCRHAPVQFGIPQQVPIADTSGTPLPTPLINEQQEHICFVTIIVGPVGNTVGTKVHTIGDTATVTCFAQSYHRNEFLGVESNVIKKK